MNSTEKPSEQAIAVGSSPAPRTLTRKTGEPTERGTTMPTRNDERPDVKDDDRCIASHEETPDYTGTVHDSCELLPPDAEVRIIEVSENGKDGEVGVLRGVDQ